MCVAVGPGGGLLKICMLIFQALPKCMHISFFGRAYVMYKPELGLVHEILPRKVQPYQPSKNKPKQNKNKQNNNGWAVDLESANNGYS